MTEVAPFQIDFSPIGDLYNTYRQSQQRAQQEQALKQFAQNGQQFDPATRQLIAANPQLGMSLAQLAQSNQRDTRNFAFQQQESTRAQGNTDRAFALQRQTTTEKPSVVWQEGPDGSKIPYRVGPMGSDVTRLPVDGAMQTEPNNPFAAPGKLTDTQSKDGLFAGRMLSAEKVLRDIDASVATDRVQKGLGTISDKIGYDLRSTEFTKFDQAKRNFINAVLRKESGAVIAESEFKNAEQQYFPQPGQGAEIIAQKREARADAIRGIAAGAGPGFRLDHKFDEKGDIVPNPKPQKAPQQQAPGAPIPGARQGKKPDGSPGWFIQNNGKTYLVE